MAIVYIAWTGEVYPGKRQKGKGLACCFTENALATREMNDDTDHSVVRGQVTVVPDRSRTTYYRKD